MLVPELVAYARKNLPDRIADPAFEHKPVRFRVEIDSRGRLTGVRETSGLVKQIGKKQIQQAKEYLVPKSPVARNATEVSYPLLCVDDLKYVAGPGPWVDDAKKEMAVTRHEAFISLIRGVAHETQDRALLAAVAFYADSTQVEEARKALALHKPKAPDLAMLCVEDGDGAGATSVPLIDLASVKRVWRERYARAKSAGVAEGGAAPCLSCGAFGPVARTHDPVKGLTSVGGQPSGVSLMSFDKEAFRSYGWDRNANSPTCPDCASAYTLALNHLVQRDNTPRTRVDHGGVAFVFWTRDAVQGPGPVDLFEEADPTEVAALLDAVHKGGGSPVIDTNVFCCVALAANGARLQVRGWFRETLDHVRRRVASWFQDLAIVDPFTGDRAHPPRLWTLLAGLDHRADVDRVPRDIQTGLLARAIGGTPLGRSLLAMALARVHRSEGRGAGIATARMGLIRMCVNDLARSNGGALMPETIDEKLPHPSYVCGRLMAVYEEVQRVAAGRDKEVNATVVDRYWALASTCPALAFPSLDSLSVKHFKKLRRDNPGAGVNLQKELQALYLLLPPEGARFPSQLSLEDRGRFAIGYHHQRAQSWAKVQRKKDTDETP